MEIYFDNSATTQCTPAVCDAVREAMQFTYGNPSSVHRKGMEAEQLLRRSRETIAKTLRCDAKEIYFTSGGTESDNWALIGGAMAHRREGNHLITTSVEHPAVMQAMRFLEGQGFRVTYLPVDRNGQIRLEDLKNALSADTILVSVMYVNNETGTVEPVREAAALVKRYCPLALFHTDAVQAYGKLDIRMRTLGVDLMSVSGHKIHGPKGIGFLYIKDKVRILPYIMGGGQQGGMRSGTDNVPGAAGLAAAAADACGRLQESAQKMRQLQNQLADGLSRMENVVIHTPLDGVGIPAAAGAAESSETADTCTGNEICAPHILNASFIGVRSEVLLHALEEENIFVSAGSACSSNKKLPVSPVLEQLDIPRDQLESALRFSFSSFNTPEEVETCLAALGKIVPMLRRYSRK